MAVDPTDEPGLLHLRLSRDGVDGVVGSVGRPEGPWRTFTGWLGLLALLEREMPPCSAEPSQDGA